MPLVPNDCKPMFWEMTRFSFLAASPSETADSSLDFHRVRIFFPCHRITNMVDCFRTETI